MRLEILYNACISYGALSDMSYHVVVGMTFRNIILEKVKVDDIISILLEYQNMWWQKWDGGFCISIGTGHECSFVVLYMHHCCTAATMRFIIECLKN